MKKTGRTRTGGSAARLTRMQDCRAGRAKPGCGAKGGNASHQLRKGERPGGEKGWMDKGKARRRNEERSTVGRERSTATRRGDCGRDPAERRRGSQRRALGNKRMGFPLVGKRLQKATRSKEGRSRAGKGDQGGGGTRRTQLRAPGGSAGVRRERKERGKGRANSAFWGGFALRERQTFCSHAGATRPGLGHARAAAAPADWLRPATGGFFFPTERNVWGAQGSRVALWHGAHRPCVCVRRPRRFGGDDSKTAVPSPAVKHLGRKCRGPLSAPFLVCLLASPGSPFARPFPRSRLDQRPPRSCRSSAPVASFVRPAPGRPQECG